MKKVVQQLVVLGTGEVQTSPGDGGGGARSSFSRPAHQYCDAPQEELAPRRVADRGGGYRLPRYNGQGSTTSVKPMNRPAIR